MKKLVFTTLLATYVSLTLFAQNIDASLLTKKDGLFYSKKEIVPFTGNAYYFFENGKTKKIVPYYEGQIDGRLTEWREDETIKTVAYFRKGKQDVEYIGSFTNGKKAIVSYYRDGKQHGEVATWWENGYKKSIAYFQDNVQDGEAKTWWENGKKASAGYYKNGQKNGKFEKWHINGKKSFEALYENGSLVGVQREWSELGELVSKN